MCFLFGLVILTKTESDLKNIIKDIIKLSHNTDETLLTTHLTQK